MCQNTGWVLQESGNYKRCECVDLKESKKNMESSGINSDKSKLSFVNYKPYDEKTKEALKTAIKFSKDFDTLKTEGKCLLLLGQSGAGKTHLAISVAINLINRVPNPIAVVYAPYLETMTKLKQNAMNEDVYAKSMERLQNAKLLVIDDLFKDKIRQGKLIAGLNEADMKHIYQILNYRYLNNLPTVISSECNCDHLIDLDEALAGRLIEKSAGFITVFNNSKYNYRLKGLR